MFSRRALPALIGLVFLSGLSLLGQAGCSDPTAVLTPVACTVDAQCDDGNVCTADRCVAGAGCVSVCKATGPQHPCCRNAACRNSPACQVAGAGVYFVSTHTADAGWGWLWENGRLIDNALDWLWPTHAASGPILLIWDNGAWTNAWKNALTARGIPWTERTGAAVTPSDLDPSVYAMIIMTEYMSNGGVANIETMSANLEDYVTGGGVLVDMIATNNVRRWSGATAGPFGVRTNGLNGAWSYMEEPGHPMLAGMTPPTTWGNWDVHGQITTPPVGSTVLMTFGDVPGGVPVACWLALDPP